MSAIWLFGVLMLPVAAATQASAPQAVMFVLDGSGSMSVGGGYIPPRLMIFDDGKSPGAAVPVNPSDLAAQMLGSRFERAKTDLAAKVNEPRPPGTLYGLVAFGHRGPGCGVETLVTPTADGKAMVQTQLASIIHPQGDTPLAQAIKQAGEALAGVDARQKHVVVFSDGIDTCCGDPVAAARELRKQDPKLKIHVVGYDLDGHAKELFEKIAGEGAGKFESVDTGITDRASNSLKGLLNGAFGDDDEGDAPAMDGSNVPAEITFGDETKKPKVQVREQPKKAPPVPIRQPEPPKPTPSPTPPPPAPAKVPKEEPLTEPLPLL